MNIKIWRWLIPSTRSTRKRKNPDWSSARKSKKSNSDTSKSDGSNNEQEKESKDRYVYSGAAYDPEYAKVSSEIEGVAAVDDEEMLGLSFEFDENEAETKKMLGQTESASLPTQAKDLEQKVQAVDSKIEASEQEVSLQVDESMNFDFIEDDGKPKSEITDNMRSIAALTQLKDDPSRAVRSTKNVFDNETALYVSLPASQAVSANVARAASGLAPVAQQPKLDSTFTSKEDFEEMFTFLGDYIRAREAEPVCREQNSSVKLAVEEEKKSESSFSGVNSGECLSAVARLNKSHTDSVAKTDNGLSNGECIGYVQRYFDSKAKSEEDKSKAGGNSFHL